jgi:RNA polymerase sigma-70 factor, ECF subfamily
MGAFDEIYAKYAAAVFRYAVKCVGRRDVAEDITSEVFLALHRNLAQIDIAQLPAWLFTVAKNRSADYWRRCDVEERYLATLPSEEPRWEPSLEAFLADTKTLKATHRACLILRYVHGMTRAEIAEELGLSDNQVKGHLQYALTLLRREREKTAS